MVESTTPVTPAEKLPHRAMAPAQTRAARAWLGWGQDELARRAHVSVNTVRNFESGHKPVHSNSVAALRQAIEAGGIRLVFDRHGAAAGILRADAEADLSAAPSV